MNTDLKYTGMALDRGDPLRRDATALEQRWCAAETRIVTLCQGKLLVKQHAQAAAHASANVSQTGGALLLRRADASELIDAVIERASHRVFLGQQATHSYFAVEVSAADGQVLCDALAATFIDLRRVGPWLSAEMAALLGYAKGLLFWRQQYQFCPRCGQALHASQGGHVLSCAQVDCSCEIYPRTDPAVIMLVERTGSDGVNRCLLGRNANWVEGSFSTLAGFVEPGESLEEAVRREVQEETGVTVGEVGYVASQPWPFPSALMVGFRATALDSNITLDPHEVAEAAWFSREEVAGFGAWGDENSRHNLPRKDSIARFLIDHWLYQACSGGD